MADMSLEQMTENYVDVLKEIGNIGAGNAMTALSQMLQCKVDMKVPQVRLLEFKEVGAMMGGEEKLMCGIFLGVEGEMELSCMKEISNIITGAYLNSLSMLTNLMIYPTPPSLTIDMAGAILSVPAIEFGTLGDKILVIQSQFFDDVEIDGYFILVPDLDSYKKILQTLGMM